MTGVADQAAEYLRAQAAEPPAPKPRPDRAVLEELAADRAAAVPPTAEYLAAKAALAKRERRKP